jgi:hypothetical protein
MKAFAKVTTSRYVRGTGRSTGLSAPAQVPAAPSLFIRSSQGSLRNLAPPTPPIRVARTGLMPTKRRMPILNAFRLWLP